MTCWLNIGRRWCGRSSVSAPPQIVTYEIQQEQFLLSDVPPLSNSSRARFLQLTVTYDMADPAQKMEMVESNTRVAVRRVRAAIQKLDPGALVTGFFRAAPGITAWCHRGRCSNPRRSTSSTSHLYPGITHDLDAGPGDRADRCRRQTSRGWELGARISRTRTRGWPRTGWRIGRLTRAPMAFAGWLVWLWATTDETVFGAWRVGVR